MMKIEPFDSLARAQDLQLNGYFLLGSLGNGHIYNMAGSAGTSPLVRLHVSLLVLTCSTVFASVKGNH